MPHQTLPMVASDVPDMFRIRDKAFGASQAPLSCLLFCPALTPATLERETERVQSKAAERAMLFYKAIDEQGASIACIRFTVVPERPQDVLSAPIRFPPRPEDCPISQQSWDNCWKTLAEVKRAVFGNVPHIYLDLMATDPAYQRRGAAQSLLSRLTKLADGTGKESHLVATDMARPVYERVGFVALREVVLDLDKMGEPVASKERFTYMIRMPSKTGME